MHVQLLLLDQILPQRQCPVASSEALDLHCWAMHTVLYQQTATAIGMASKVAEFFHCSFVSCRSGGHRGNTEQVVI
jgi:hypothetical protein